MFSLTGNNGELFNSSPKIQPTALNIKKKKTVEIKEFSPPSISSTCIPSAFLINACNFFFYLKTSQYIFSH